MEKEVLIYDGNIIDANSLAKLDLRRIVRARINDTGVKFLAVDGEHPVPCNNISTHLLTQLIDNCHLSGSNCTVYNADKNIGNIHNNIITLKHSGVISC